MSEGSHSETPVPRTSRSTLIIVFAGIALGLALIYLIGPGGRSSSENAMFFSRNNLKQLALSLHNYHEQYRVLPPAVTLSAEGEALHGWPVQILPFLDEDTLYHKIDLNKPYSDPANQAVMSVEILTFRNPMLDDSVSPPDALNYALNVRVFREQESLKFENVTDGLADTIMGGEISQAIGPWYTPGQTRDPARGLNRDALTFGSPYFGERAYRGVQMVMMDGSVHVLSDQIDPQVLKALATPDAGDSTRGYP